MGKRKKASKPMGPRKRETLPTTFTCLFCNHEESVSVKLDKKAGVGSLECKVCGQRFQCGINYLSAAVDVYGEWVDAADAVADQEKESTESRYEGTSRRTQQAGRQSGGDDDDDGDLGYGGDGIVADDADD